MSTALTVADGSNGRQWISHRPPDDFRKVARLGWIIIILFFGVLGGWAALAPLNAAVIGDGVVKVEGNRKSIQNLEGGTVKEVLIREGNRVKEGETLIVLDDVPVRTQLAILQQQEAQLSAVLARLSAEAEGRNTISFPSNLAGKRNDAMSSALIEQAAEFRSRRSALDNRKSVLVQRRLQYESQIAGVAAQKIALESKIGSLEEEKKSVAGLVERKLATKSRLSELERASTQASAELDAIRTNEQVLLQTRTEVEAQVKQIETDYLEDVAQQLRDTRMKLNDVSPRLDAARKALDNTHIKSPYSGTVVGLTVFSVGGVIRPGDKLMDIVPDDSPLDVEAKIRVEDISEIRPGMKAEVHFTSYKQKTLPLIHGSVRQISADRFTDDRTQMPYYTALIDVDEKELAEVPQIELYPGMPASVVITTHERSALDYLLGPLLPSLDRSFRER